VLATYRPDREPRDLTAADLDDMRFLMSAEPVRKGVQIHCANTVENELGLPAAQVRQILLNLALNAIAVSPQDGHVALRASCEDNRLLLEVSDQGPGLPSHAQAILTGSRDGPPSLAEGSGLGLWMTRRMVAELNGAIDYQPQAEGGTLIRVDLPLSVPAESRHVA
jgi:signal transduction histidine kinase